MKMLTTCFFLLLAAGVSLAGGNRVVEVRDQYGHVQKVVVDDHNRIQRVIVDNHVQRVQKVQRVIVNDHAHHVQQIVVPQRVIVERNLFGRAIIQRQLTPNLIEVQELRGGPIRRAFQRAFGLRTSRFAVINGQAILIDD